MSAAQIKLPAKLIPVFTGEADVRGAFGGRGSAKTRSFALMTAVRAYKWAAEGRNGQILCARQFMESLSDSSMEEVKQAILSEPWLAAFFDIGEKYIRTKGLPGRVYYTFRGLDRNIDSVKSQARILLCWVDEAEPVVDAAWTKLIPTLREEDSELWVTWNPERKNSATHKRFRQSKDPRYKVIEMNWRDNPKFPAVLERQRIRDQRERPDQYDHIWEGDFVTAIEGAYFAQGLSEAKAQGRIGRVAPDPLMTLRAYWDIGGTGAKADSTSIWIVQFIAREIRVLNYYEAQGQPLASHVQWLRDNGYAKAQCILPHDGTNHEKVYSATYEGALREAGFDVRTIPNQGAGAAKMRIEAVRRIFGSIWFNEETTQAGRDALGWYHEKRSDDERNVGLGPEHDWSSHGCFLGTTEVLTRYGMCQIMNLPETGEILTPCGWKQYVLPRVTKRDAPLVEVTFTDGLSVKCTPDHLFLTENGWKSAESLTPNTAIRSTLTKSRSISMVAFTACGRARSIYRAVVNGFTEMFGAQPLGQSRMAAISTTGTATSSITDCQIWNAFHRINISQSRAPSEALLTMGGFQTARETRRLSGTNRQKANCGIAVRQSAAKAGLNGSAKKSRANNAASFTWLLLERAAIRVNSALRLARLRLTESAAIKTNGRVTIAHVRQLRETADVWDITVPDGHCFSLSNGAVVHNSDAFGLMAIDYEAPPDRRPESHRYQGAQSWMT